MSTILLAALFGVVGAFTAIGVVTTAFWLVDRWEDRGAPLRRP